MCPFIVDRIASAHLAFPVEGESNLVQLLSVARNILCSSLLWMLSGLYGILLCGESIGIVSHRIQHVVALLALIASVDVAGNIAQWVTHMESGSRGVGEHVEHVEFLFCRVFCHAVGFHLYPALLPLLFDVSKIVFHIFVFFVFFLFI